MSSIPFPARQRTGISVQRAQPVPQLRPAPMRPPMRPAALLIFAVVLLFEFRPSAQAASSSRLPEIRMHRHNGVPACVTTDRLMAFLKMRNGQLSSRYRDIAKWYRRHGEAWRVRWDYAFFQMALETNFLTYRRANGDRGDVHPRQNNFAGIGATGGGVSGDRFPDVGTGVLAQIQHLVAYSGEQVDRPVARRTALKQNDIVATMRRLHRPPRFSDLARRWAADPRYANSIARIAESYQRTFCQSPDNARAARPGAQSSLQPQPPAPSPAAKARAKRVAKTIWQRDDAPPRTATMAPPLPQPAQRTFMPEEPTSGSTTLASQMLPGLQTMARSMNRNVSAWPEAPAPAPAIIAPQPKIANRAPQLASRQ